MQTQRADQGDMTESGDRPLLSVLLCVASPLAGAAIAFWLLVTVLIPTIGVGDVQRIIDLGAALESPLPQEPTAAIIGNSVLIEGINASMVAEAAPPGWHARNFAINGCDLTEQQILLPRLIETGPEVIVMVIRPIDVGAVTDVNLSKLHAYSLSGFTSSFPEGYAAERLPGLSDESRSALLSTRFDSLLHFRRAPLTTAESLASTIARRGTATRMTDDWNEPANLTGSISGARLDRHFRVVAEERAKRIAGGETAGAEHIERAARDLRDAGITPVIVVAPIHPQMPGQSVEALARLRSLLADLSDRYGAITGDAHDMLGAEDFADAIHPNAQGRQKLSAYIGSLLPPAPLATRDSSEGDR
jgi:hypothetical protein